MFLLVLVCAISFGCTFVSTVQPSDMASKFEQVHSECQRRVLSVAIDKEDPDFLNTLCIDCHIELNKKINNNWGYDLVPKVADYGSRVIKVLAVLIGLRKQDLHCSKITVLLYQQIVKKKKGWLSATEKTPPKYCSVCSNCFQQIY